MAFYAVRDDGGSNIGTATGDGGRYASVTATDNWATAFGATTGYYQSIELALAATTSPAAGDIILVANDSDFSDSGALTYSASVAGVMAVSVDVNNVGQSLAGAKESTGSGSDLQVSTGNANFRSYGIDYDVGDDVHMGSANTVFLVENGTIAFNGSGDRFNLDADGTHVKLINTNVTYPTGSASHVVKALGGSFFEMIGGAISGGSGNINDLIGDSGANGGFKAHFTGVNVEDIDEFLLAEFGASTGDDMCDVLIDGCKTHASVADVEEAFNSPNKIYQRINSSSVGSAAEYNDHEVTWAGSIEDMDSSGIVRIDDVTFESGENTSLQLTTNANCGIARPLVFELSGRYTKLSGASEDTMIVYFAVINTVTLTNTNFYAEILNPDGTTANLWDYSTSRNADILATGTEWTDDSGSSVWEDNGVDLTGYNEYRMEITISGGGDGYPIIRLNLTEPSLAGTMYVSKDVGVS